MIVMSRIEGAKSRYKLLENVLKPWMLKLPEMSQRITVAAAFSYFQLFADDVKQYVDLVEKHLDNPSDQGIIDDLRLATSMMQKGAIVDEGVM